MQTLQQSQKSALKNIKKKLPSKFAHNWLVGLLVRPGSFQSSRFLLYATETVLLSELFSSNLITYTQVGGLSEPSHLKSYFVTTQNYKNVFYHIHGLVA